MKDIVGEDIQVGQRVAFPALAHRNLVVGTVTRITKCFCFVDYQPNSSAKKDGRIYSVRLYSNQVKAIHERSD